MIAQLHREPAHVDRADWQFQHITEPRPAWWEGEAGQRRRLERAMKDFFVGASIDLGDGRSVTRDQLQLYTVWEGGMIAASFSNRRALMDYLTDTPAPEPERPPAPSPKRVSQYHNVYYRKRDRLWQAELWVGGKRHFLGLRKNEADAARLVDAFIVEHALNRPLNFPLEDAA